MKIKDIALIATTVTPVAVGLYKTYQNRKTKCACTSAIREHFKDVESSLSLDKSQRSKIFSILEEKKEATRNSILDVLNDTQKEIYRKLHR